MSAGTIFISIAAYREFDLRATLNSAMSNAAMPERLHFCICWQRDISESLGDWEQHPQMQILDIPYRESRGVCWARHLIGQHYDGQDYFLQLDGHHRFQHNWDIELVRMLESLRSESVPLPVLTAYLPSYDPQNDPAARSQDVWLLGSNCFDDSGVVFMRPYIPQELPEAPVPVRFWSAHFSFSDGSFLVDVPTDPEGYFHGEEISNCVRGWTRGYDFFSPHKTLLWHEYSRKGRRCHWDDHVDWLETNKRAIARYRALVGVDGIAIDEPKGFGLGRSRTLQQYEKFAGISFANRSISSATLANETPVLGSQNLEPQGAFSERSLGARVPQRNPQWDQELLDDQLVVFDRESTAACYLSPSAALIWQLIDGERSVDDICELIRGAYGDIESLNNEVTLALSDLRSQRAITL